MRECFLLCFFGGSVSHDKMLGVDATIHANNVEEAYAVANKYWHKLQEYQTLMGHVDQFNLDCYQPYC